MRNLSRILKGCGDLFVVQIGSNDGATDDPIFKLLARNPSWHALLVEPVPFLFERLRANYRDNKNIKFENVAISDKVGKSAFYYVDQRAKQHIPDLPFWFDQLGSFDRNHISRHFGEVLEPFIQSIELTTIPLAEMLARNGVTTIDVLHIDTEGYDWKILQQLDLRMVKPKAILFEHKHLSAADKASAREFLGSGYSIRDLGNDLLCVRV